MTEQEAIEIAMGDDTHIDFTGQNCDDYENRNCMGWDGESRRCDCGNRRVFWAFVLDENKKILYAYGEAY